jgi:hypothetical protein
LLAPFADPPSGFPARDRLARTVDEERARAADEAALDESAGELVRGILSTWRPPATPSEWPERDAWIARHLLEIRDSLRGERPRTGPNDLDEALYPLERLLAPLQFPRGAAAIAEVRIAVDADRRAVPPLTTRERLEREVKVYLGVDVDPAALPERFEALERSLYERATEAAKGAKGVADVPTKPARATRSLLFTESPCGSPPERAAICGLASALAGQSPNGKLAVLHDDVLLAIASVSRSPPPRTRLLSGPDDDVVDATERAARERPIVAIGLALAAELIVRYEDVDGLDGWSGDAPLDLVERAFVERRGHESATSGEIRFADITDVATADAR